MVSAERLRPDEADTGREDYGRGDNTWSYFSHEQAIFDGNRYFDIVIERPGLFVDLGPWPSHRLARP